LFATPLCRVLASSPPCHQLSRKREFTAETATDAAMLRLGKLQAASVHKYACEPANRTLPEKYSGRCRDRTTPSTPARSACERNSLPRRIMQQRQVTPRIGHQPETRLLISRTQQGCNMPKHTREHDIRRPPSAYMNLSARFCVAREEFQHHQERKVPRQ